MADDQEKTEEPTQKKIQDAREEGNVPKSMDTSAIFTIFIVTLALLVLFPYIAERTEQLMRYYFALQGLEIDKELAYNIAITTFKEFLLIALPLALVAALAGVIGNVAQIGFLFTTKVLVPDLKKLNPINGLKNLVAPKKILDGMLMTVKSLTAMGIGFFFFWIFTQELPVVTLYSLGDQLEWVRDKAIILTLILMGILFIYAMIDLVLKRTQYTKSLRMSKQEVKDEMKNMEGDPKVKAKIRQIQMQAAMKRMMSNIPEADVVITNPTHYAVAIKYDEGKHHAPVVVAKGKDNLALNIKQIAREHGIHIVQNPPLARSLYAEVEVDHPIPEALFAAVAEVLAYVYKMNNQR
jgi:flagellar biosynthetic protein FlhB